MSSESWGMHALPASDSGASEEQLALAQVCTDKALSTIATKLEKWEPISSHLSITNAEAIEIKNNHQGDYRQQKTRLLQLWKAKAGKAATYKCLVDVIQATLGDSLPEDICEMAVDTYHAMKSPQGRKNCHRIKPTVNDLMNISPLIGAKWGLVGTKLGISEGTLTQISVAGDDIKCSAKMLRIWYSTENFPSWADLLRVLELPFVGLLDIAERLKVQIYSSTSPVIRTGFRHPNGLSVRVPTESSKMYICLMVDLVELLPPDSWRKMKIALELYKDPISSLCPEEMDTAVYEHVSSVSEMLKSLQKHRLVTPVELGWLKFLVGDVVKCSEASKRIRKYEVAIEPDTLLGKVHFANNQQTTEDTAMLYCRAEIQPETATCQNLKLAKAGSTCYVGVQEHEAVLHSVRVGSVIFFWKIPLRIANNLKLSKSVSLETKKMLDNAKILEISIMIGDSYETVSVDNMTVAVEESVQAQRKLSLQSPTAVAKVKRKLSDSRKFWLVLRRTDSLYYQLEFYINRQAAHRARDASEVIPLTEIIDVQLSKNQKHTIEMMCEASGYSLGLNCESEAERWMSDLQYLVTEYHKLCHQVHTQPRHSSISKLREVDEQCRPPDSPVKAYSSMFSYFHIRPPQTLNCVVKCSFSQLTTSQMCEGSPLGRKRSTGSPTLFKAITSLAHSMSEDSSSPKISGLCQDQRRTQTMSGYVSFGHCRK